MMKMIAIFIALLFLVPAAALVYISAIVIATLLLIPLQTLALASSSSESELFTEEHTQFQRSPINEDFDLDESCLFDGGANDFCRQFTDDQGNPYYTGFIDGCISVEGNTIILWMFASRQQTKW